MKEIIHGFLKIKIKPLIKKDGFDAIFLADIDHQKAILKPVKIGITEGPLAEIIDPEDLSGHVIVLGQHLLEDGSSIYIPDKEQPLTSTKKEAR